MATETLVFFKQLLENSEYANEKGVLNVIGHFKDADPDVTEGTSYALGAFDMLERLIELRPDLLTPAVVAKLEQLAADSDQRVSSAARAALEIQAEESVAKTDAGEVPERTKPASSRTSDLAAVRDRLERELGTDCPNDLFGDDAHAGFREYVEEHFAPPEYSYKFIFTPGELCDLVDCYADQLSVRWSEGRGRLDAESDVLVDLSWLAHPEWHGITVAGLYAFRKPQDAREVWVEMGVYPEGLPLERMLGVRDRFALNFQGGGGSFILDPNKMDDIRPDELWPRIWRYCTALGAPIDA